MFRFASIHLLFGLALVPLMALLLWWSGRQRRRLMRRFGDSRLMGKLAATVNRAGRAWKGILVVCALTALLTALARPQFGTRVETVQREGQDIVVALDVSASMLAEDIAPNRLEKAKHAIGTLIDRLRGDRIALVAFAGDAFIQCPLTLDYAAARMFLASMGPDLISRQGTDLGEALKQSLKAFQNQDASHRVILLITDGEDHEGDVEERLDEAHQGGVVIHAVGIGSPQGVPIPELDESGNRIGFKKDRSGEVVVTRLDEEILRKIASESGGRYFRATASESELDEIAAEVAGMEKKELAQQEITQYEEQYQLFLLLALVLLAAETAIPERRRLRRVWKGRFQ